MLCCRVQSHGTRLLAVTCLVAVQKVMVACLAVQNHCVKEGVESSVTV